MDIFKTDKEKEDRRKGWIGTTIAHFYLFLFLIWSFAPYPDPPPGQEGILISFGQQNVGEGEEQPKGVEDGEMIAETAESAETSPSSEPIAEARPEAAPPESSASKPERKLVTTEDPSAVAASKKKEEAASKLRKEKQKKAADAKKKSEAEQAKKDAEDAKKKAAADAKKRAEEEAKKQAEEEAKKFEEAKKKFGSMLGGDGSQGTSGKPGDAGTLDGDPDSKNLEGTNSFGKGDKDVGGGLAGRGVISRPDVRDNSQETGYVRVKVCVNQAGQVTKADYTITGSSTQNSKLVEKAVNGAKKFKFEKGERTEQCGHITFHFKFGRE